MAKAKLSVVNAEPEAAAAWLDKLLDDPPEGSVIVTIGVPLARAMLSHNLESNRNRSPEKLAVYTRELDDEAWMLTGETVKFSSEQKLIDGQTRLEAVLRSGKPLRTHVVFNIDPAAFVVLDTGRRRSAADTLVSGGLRLPYTSSRGANPSASTVSGALRWLHRYEQHGPQGLLSRHGLYERETKSYPRFSNALAIRLWRANPGIIDSATVGRRIWYETRLPPASLAALHYLAGKGPYANDRDDFFEKLETGLRLTAGEPVTRLRNWVAKWRTDYHAPGQQDVIGAVCEAWNATCRRQPLPRGWPKWPGLTPDIETFEGPL